MYICIYVYDICIYVYMYVNIGEGAENHGGRQGGVIWDNVQHIIALHTSTNLNTAHRA